MDAQLVMTERLRGSDGLKYLQRLQLGTKLLTIWYVGLLIFFLAAGIGSLFWLMQPDLVPRVPPPENPARLTARTANLLSVGLQTGAGLLLCIAPIIWSAGWWFLTTPTPGIRPPAPGNRSRLVTRGSVLAGALGVLIIAIGTIGLIVSGSRRARFGAWSASESVGLGATIMMLAEGVSFFASLLYMRVMAQNLANVRLRRIANWLLWTSIASAVMLIPAQVILEAARGPALAALMALAVIAVSVILFVVFYGIFLARWRSALASLRQGAATPAG